MAYHAEFAITTTFPDLTSQNVGYGNVAVRKREKESKHFMHRHTHFLTNPHNTPTSCPTSSDLYAIGLVDLQVAIVVMLYFSGGSRGLAGGATAPPFCFAAILFFTRSLGVDN